MLNAPIQNKKSQKFNEFTLKFTKTGIDAMQIGKNFYLAQDRLKSIKSGVERDPYAIGLFLGEESREFEPSPAYVDMLSKMPESEHKKIFINSKAEWLFLCGRNVLEDSIVKNPSKITDGLVFVQNERGENLGYGLMMKQGRDLVVRNLLDKGQYLRNNEKGRKKSSD